MNKADLTEILSQKTGLSHSRAHEYVNALFDAMQEKLAAGEKVSISDFGTFTVSTRKAFQGHNPKTGTSISVPSVRTPTFKAGKGLKGAMNS